MSNLAFSGMSSLKAVNQWISVIDTNLTNTKRIGYKETRVNLSAGSVDHVGTVNAPGKPMNIDIPSATLLVNNTEILDYVQGNLTSTGTNTDFALDGEGYFVVEDKFGQRYATRDGEFHFDNDGYLVTQQGLKVLSSGQDWIRVPISEHFLIDNQGKTAGIQEVNGLTTSKYGERKLMVVRLPDNKKLHYSKYGFTTFDLGGFLPVDLNNNFKTTMDGLNPDRVQSINGGVITSNENFFKRYSVGGIAVPTSSGLSPQAVVTSHQFKDFSNSFTFAISGNNHAPSLGFSFGLSEKDLKIDSSVLPATEVTRGYNAGFINNSLVITDKSGNVIGSTAVPPGLISTSGGYYLHTLTLTVDDGKATIKLDSKAPSGTVTSYTATANVGNNVEGYQTIGTLNKVNGIAQNSGYGAANISIYNLQVKQLSSNEYFDMNVVATKRSNEYSGGNKYNTQYDMVDPDSTENIDTSVRQQFLEESTSTIADTIPMLSSTQKLFAAISKIINIANSVTDDINALIR